MTSREGKGPDSDATSGMVLAFQPKASSHQSMNPSDICPTIGISKEPGVFLAHTLRADGFDASEDGTGRGTPIVAFDTTQMTSAANRNNPQPGDPCHPLAAGAHAPSITGTIPRRLTPRECERLQGFPDDWTRWDHEGKELADGPRYRMLGNAVAVPCAEWIGRRLAGSVSGGRAVD